MAVTWYLGHHHNHIPVSVVVGGGLAHICNNLSEVARSVYIRSVPYSDNSLRDDVFGCSTLLPAWHLAESCACAKVFIWAVKWTCFNVMAYLLNISRCVHNKRVPNDKKLNKKSSIHFYLWISNHSHLQMKVYLLKKQQYMIHFGECNIKRIFRKTLIKAQWYD